MLTSQSAQGMLQVAIENLSILWMWKHFYCGSHQIYWYCQDWVIIDVIKQLPTKWQIIWRRFALGKNRDVPIRIPSTSTAKHTRQIAYAIMNYSNKLDAGLLHKSTSFWASLGSAETAEESFSFRVWTIVKTETRWPTVSKKRVGIRRLRELRPIFTTWRVSRWHALELPEQPRVLHWREKSTKTLTVQNL